MSADLFRITLELEVDSASNLGFTWRRANRIAQGLERKAGTFRDTKAVPAVGVEHLGPVPGGEPDA